MNFFTRYSKLLQSIVVALFFIGNTGFTVVLTSCCCSNKLVETDQCNKPASMATQCAKATAHSGAASVPSRNALTPAGSSCQMKITVGGLNPILGLLEKEDNAQPAKAKVSPVAIVAGALPALPVLTQKTFSSLSEEHSSPPVEKYVLFASFLI